MTIRGQGKIIFVQCSPFPVNVHWFSIIFRHTEVAWGTKVVILIPCMFSRTRWKRRLLCTCIWKLWKRYSAFYKTRFFKDWIFCCPCLYEFFHVTIYSPCLTCYECISYAFRWHSFKTASRNFSTNFSLKWSYISLLRGIW